MPSEAASAAASAITSGIPFDVLIKYGSPGLAVIVLALSFNSLRSLQKDASVRNLPDGYLPRFFWLQLAYVGAAIIIFAVAVFAPTKPVNNAHTVGFSLSPPDFDDNKLFPMLVVVGGDPVKFSNGTGKDNFSGERSYQFSVNELWKSRESFRLLSEEALKRTPIMQPGEQHNAQANR